jgi:hypothetical protein
MLVTAAKRWPFYFNRNAICDSCVFTGEDHPRSGHRLITDSIFWLC